MTMQSRLLVSSILLLSACGAQQEDTAAATPSTPASYQPPVPDDPNLAIGYRVWRQDCRNCHLLGREGAPKTGDAAAWALRKAKGMDVLYDHALNGWLAPSMAEMPAKGGNPDLSDDEVRRAVDYQVYAAEAAPR